MKMAAKKKAVEKDLPVIEAKLKEHQFVSTSSKVVLFMKLFENLMLFHMGFFAGI